MAQKTMTLGMMLSLLLVFSGVPAPVAEASNYRENLLPTAVLGAGVLGLVLMNEPVTPHWQSEVLLDHGARSAFRASTREGRETADMISDFAIIGTAMSPFAAASLGGGARVPAVNTLHWAANAFLFNAAITMSTKKIIARERPWMSECRVSGECDSEEFTPQSFISGHTSFAFTGAGLLCSPDFRNLAGIKTDDGARYCAAALAAAAGTGMLRIVADKHYSSDVIAGAAVGLVSGMLMPSLLWKGTVPQPQIAARGVGLQFSFLF